MNTVDPYGTTHTCEVIHPPSCLEFDGYESEHPGLRYTCGCEPLRHRFRCLECLRWCGWCFGCADDLPTKCDDCWKEPG